MNDPGTSDVSRQTMEDVHEAARFITLYGTPAGLGLIGLYLVFARFDTSLSAGLRSLAAVLLPVIVASFLFAFNRTVLQRVANVSTAAGVTGGLGMGLLVMTSLRFFGRDAAPLPEILVSGCFAVLVFSSASDTAGRALAWYYGVMSGLLLYLIIWGLPVTGGV